MFRLTLKSVEKLIEFYIQTYLCMIKFIELYFFLLKQSNRTNKDPKLKFTTRKNIYLGAGLRNGRALQSAYKHLYGNVPSQTFNFFYYRLLPSPVLLR